MHRWAEDWLSSPVWESSGRIEFVEMYTISKVRWVSSHFGSLFSSTWHCLFERGERKILKKIPPSVDARAAAEGRGAERPHVRTVPPVL